MNYSVAVANSRLVSKCFFNIKIILVSLSLLFSCVVNAQVFNSNAKTLDRLKPSIEGYSPVSYFTKSIAEKGQSEFAVQYEGSTYFLTSTEQMEIFSKNPSKYRPKYSICPYSLTLGMKLPLDPTNFKIIGDTLLMFHLSDDVDGLIGWNASAKTDGELLEAADYNYTLLNF